MEHEINIIFSMLNAIQPKIRYAKMAPAAKIGGVHGNALATYRYRMRKFTRYPKH